MESQEYCSWLRVSGSQYSCGLRNVALPKGEVAAKCTKTDRSVMCIDAYSSLAKGQGLIKAESTDSLLWLIEAATQFENLGETDNAILAILEGVEFALEKNLTTRAYELFRYARTVYENGVARNDPALVDPTIKARLVDAGRRIVDTARALQKDADMRMMQAELKAAILSGGGLKRVEREEIPTDIHILDGRQLYAKKAQEYKEGAEKYISSGIVKNAVVFACLGALSDLMLGRPKDGVEYLKRVAGTSGFIEEFHRHPCFNWTKLVFKALINRDREAIEQARKEFFSIPWAFKDDQEFARRVMDSVYRRITAGQ